MRAAPAPVPAPVPARPLAASLAPVLAVVLATSGPAPARAAESLTADPRFQVSVLASGLVNPWGIAPLGDGRHLVTERPGRLRVMAADGSLSEPLAGVPAVAALGQGGLLDVAVDRDFARNRTIYLTYAEPGPGGAGTAAARATLGPDGLSDVKVIFRQTPKLAGGRHFGSRIVQAADGMLFVTTGDRGEETRVRDWTNTIGKIVRITPDGAVPPDNPFVGRSDRRPEIWSGGHRNVQGAALDASGRLVTVEHGARGGDEVNAPGRGLDYGWPTITYGVDYSGARIGEGTAKPGLEQPLHYWDPSIAPSGLALYRGAAFPDWQGSLIAGALRGALLVRLTLKDGGVVGEERLLVDLRRRIRDVEITPEGNIMVLTDSPQGEVLLVSPAKR